MGGSARSLLDRFQFSAQMFLPNGEDGVAAVKDAEETVAKLLHTRMRSQLAKAQDAWRRVQDLLSEFQLKIDHVDAFNLEGELSGPLCALCLLPAASLEFDSSNGNSALWRGCLWHCQCANFWIKYGSVSPIIEELGLTDPFKERDF